MARTGGGSKTQPPKTMVSAVYNTLASGAVASVSTGTVVGAVGLAAVSAVGNSQICSLLDNLAAHFVEAQGLKEDLQQAYNMLVRTTDKFSLRNSEFLNFVNASAQNRWQAYYISC